MLDEKQVIIKATVNARKERIDADAAWDLLQSATSITTAKGKKIRDWNPETDDKADILKQVMGPSGNLRAPALRIKDTFVIGFNKELYDQVF
ncbi:MAG: hypothetical protein HF978_01795 [Desulfobacteraceae bacterium]|nr:hypothetical protein [Desulfobacteraceae bacterium]MBC2754256.1 hypothetical protein [Desulfobacteraceae bacterium]